MSNFKLDKYYIEIMRSLFNDAIAEVEQDIIMQLKMMKGKDRTVHLTHLDVLMTIQDKIESKLS